MGRITQKLVQKVKKERKAISEKIHKEQMGGVDPEGCRRKRDILVALPHDLNIKRSIKYRGNLAKDILDWLSNFESVA